MLQQQALMSYKLLDRSTPSGTRIGAVQRVRAHPSLPTPVAWKVLGMVYIY